MELPAGCRPSIALVGCGAWGSLILRDLRALDCDVHVVARSPASIERATTGGARSIVGAVTELPRCDGVIVATTASTHAEVIESVLPFGVPVFVEKPLCDDLAAAESIAARASDRVFVMDKWRYHNGVLAAAAMVRNGDIGVVNSLTLRRVSRGNHHPDVDPLWTFVPHDLAITLEVLGAIPDLVSARFESIDGRLVGVHADLGDRPTVHIEVSTAAPSLHRELRIVGDGGSIVLAGGYATELLVSRGLPTDDPELVAFDQNMPLFDELATFTAHLAGGPAPRSNLDDAIAQMRVIAAMHDCAGVSVAAYREGGW